LKEIVDKTGPGIKKNAETVASLLISEIC